MIKNEVWKDVPKYEGNYQVSNLGRVKSLKYKSIKRELILKNYTDRYGYLVCTLCKNGKSIKKTVHRLVAETFLGKFKLVVNHKNGIKTDNNIDNLEFVTHKENIIHAYKLGLYNDQIEKLRQKNLNRLSKDHPSSKLSEEDVIKIRKLRELGETCGNIAKRFSISKTHVSDIVNFKTWNKLSVDKDTKKE